MSALFPHAIYAEDQRLSRTILTTHVLHRGFQSGATAGILAGVLRSIPLLRPRSALSVQAKSASLPAATSPSRFPTASAVTARSINSMTATQTAKQAFFPTAWLMIERSAGVGAVLGLGAMAVMLPYRMRDAELIEWQDRTWRLLANPGQIEVDWWSLGFATAGVTAVVTRLAMGNLKGEFKNAVGWKNVVGGAGIGSMIGVMGYLGWRYGVMKSNVKSNRGGSNI